MKSALDVHPDDQSPIDRRYKNFAEAILGDEIYCNCAYRCDWPDNPGHCGWCGGEIKVEVTEEQPVRLKLDVPNVPAILDDATLNRALTGRLDWERLSSTLNGLNGYELFELEEQGAAVMEEVSKYRGQIKQYKSDFEKWYWDEKNPFAMVERAAEIFAKQRIAEMKRADDVEMQCKSIDGQFLAAKQAAEDAQIALAQAEDRCKKEEEKKRELAAAVADGRDKAEVEQIKARPLTLTSITRAQASVGLTATPKGLSGRPVYVRQVTDPKQFYKWLGEHPDEAVTLGLDHPNFTKYKNNKEKVIPGVEVTYKMETTHRGR